MSRELEVKVAKVTGAPTGIGKAIAHGFGAAGANVVDMPDLAEAVVAQLSRVGGEAPAVAARHQQPCAVRAEVVGRRTRSISAAS
jgi:NAD(P)-dependent dehydrogenase (short-subunit alcohol dehydrogenase family)